MGHAGRVHARLHGRVVARLSRIGGLQPQRHDAHVRDAIGRRKNARHRNGTRHRRDGGRARAGPGRRHRTCHGSHRTGRLAAAGMVPRPADSSGCRRELLPPQQHELHGDRGPVGSAADIDVSEPGPREFLSEDTELNRRRQVATAVRLCDSRAARHDTCGDARQHPARPADRGRPGENSDQNLRRSLSRRLVRHQARPAVRTSRQEPPRAPELSRSQPHHLRRQRMDDGAGDAGGREGDQGQGDSRCGRDAGRSGSDRRARLAERARPEWPWRTWARTT